MQIRPAERNNDTDCHSLANYQPQLCLVVYFGRHINHKYIADEGELKEVVLGNIREVKRIIREWVTKICHKSTKLHIKISYKVKHSDWLKSLCQYA